MKHMMSLRRMADGHGGWSRQLSSKIFRKAWWTYNKGWKHPQRAGGKRWCREAKVVHTDSMHLLEKHADPKRVLATVYDLIPHHDGDARQTRRLERLSRAGGSFITGSRYVAGDLAELFPEASERIHWFHLGLDRCFQPSTSVPDQQSWLSRLGLREDEPWFVAQTGCLRRKNLAGAVRAVHKLREQEKIPFRLVFVGYTFDVAEMLDEELPANLNWREFTIFTGIVQDCDFAHIYARAVALIFLSRAEGFGYAPLEAMGCGLPAVASNCTSTPEVIGEAGPVFAPDDLDDVCAEMLALWENPDYRENRVQRSLAQASKFTWQKAAARVGEVWQKMANAS